MVRLLLVMLVLMELGACVDAPLGETEPVARIVIEWDPTECGEPHRVVIELEDDRGEPMSASTPCGIGSLTLDAELFGFYRGRVYAWSAGMPVRGEQMLRLEVDAPVVRWFVPTPR